MTNSRFFALHHLAAALVHTLDSCSYANERDIGFGSDVANLFYRANEVKERDLEEALRLVNEAKEFLDTDYGKMLEARLSFEVGAVIEAICNVCDELLKRNGV